MTRLLVTKYVTRTMLSVPDHKWLEVGGGHQVMKNCHLVNQNKLALHLHNAQKFLIESYLLDINYQKAPLGKLVTLS